MSKLTLGIAAVSLTASLGAFAALPTGAQPFQINVPNLTSGFEVSLSGLYLRPTNNDLVYGSSTQHVGLGTITKHYSVKPSYKVGFELGAGYVFPDSGNDVKLNWTHLSSSFSDSFSEVARIVSFGDDGIVIKTTGTANLKYNAADLNVGQYVNIGTRLQMRLFAGLRYAEIDHTLTSNIFTPVFYESESQTKETIDSSQMRGIGPRFGTDAEYHIANCVGLTGGVSTALLSSRMKVSENDTTTTSQPDGNSQVVKTSTTTDNQNRIVPNVDAHLGMNYTHDFNGSLVGLEGGYKVSHYFGAVDSVSSGHTSDFSVAGPYLTLSLKV